MFIDTMLFLLVVNVDDVRKHYVKKKLAADFFKLLPLWILHYVFQSKLMKMNVYLRLFIEGIIFAGPMLWDMFLQHYQYFRALRQEVKVKLSLRKCK